MLSASSTSPPSLPATVVGLDVETTSLDPLTGEIIEFAAIRYDTPTNQPIGEYTSLCRPQKSIPVATTAITGITNTMVADQKPFSSYANQLKRFIGADTIFAHNAQFDLGYLAHHKLTLRNDIWDTFLLSSLAWPCATSYNLSLLLQDNGLTTTTEHRASADVKATWQLLQKIIERLSVSDSLYNQIRDLLIKSKNKHYLPLFSQDTNQAPPQKTPPPIPPPSRSINPKTTLQDILGKDGIISKTILGFSYRPQQLSLAKFTLNTLTRNHISLAEAGASTGKTFGYLVPLLLHFNRNRARTTSQSPRYVISTFTKRLQEQLYRNDIPTLINALGININVAILKDRANYLCSSRLRQALDHATITSTDAFLLLKLLLWQSHDPSGDLDNINLSHQDSQLIHHLCANSAWCRHYCPQKNPHCPYYQAKQRAATANLIIINHALLTQAHWEDSALNPPHLIIDEAHRLTEAVRASTQRDLSQSKLVSILTPFIQLTQSSSMSSHQHCFQEAQLLIKRYQSILCHTLPLFRHDYLNKNLLRLTPSFRNDTRWKKISASILSWRNQFNFFIGLVKGLTINPADSKKISDALDEAKTFAANVKSFFTGSSQRVQWIEYKNTLLRDKPPKVILHDLSVDVRPRLVPLFDNASSVLLTSATLSVNNSFSYIKARTGITNCQELLLNTPFNYKQPMLLYIVDDAPSPTDNNYLNYVTNSLLATSRSTAGRLLGLFTTRYMVKKIYHHLIGPLSTDGIKLFAQDISGGRHNLIKKFTINHNSVLLTTYGFWEEINIPSENLSLVAITKLPFCHPNDPIINAISEHEQINPFNQLQVPLMILKLRQVIERLIRSQNDFGAVVIYDSRFLRHDYGQLILSSLPTTYIGHTSNLLPTLIKWLGPQRLEE